MRDVIKPQLALGEVDIAEVRFDPRSRDEIPKLLLGLQHIYVNPEIKLQVFSVLEEMLPAYINAHTGRPGMDLWRILVLGTLRLNCNWDYDKLQEMANNHLTLRRMLGHGVVDKDYTYALQTLKDNIRLFTVDILDRINQIVVNAGHRLVHKKKGLIKAKCDSFVVETNVHFPTDINLLLDAMRKVITLLGQLYADLGLSLWRQSSYNLRKLKKLFRRVQKMKHSTSKDDKKKAKQESLIISAYEAYLSLAQSFLKKARENLGRLQGVTLQVETRIEEIESYIVHAERQVDQIQRRVIRGEKIPHDEKVFSIFEEHTEWISKGKAGVPQELGLRVCVVEDNFGFILHHRVMERQTDDKIAVPITLETKYRFPELYSMSFDKGFYSPLNKQQLSEILASVILPKKGKLSQAEKELEHGEAFVTARRQHSAVESGINALEHHGLDVCPDHGITGFKRYVALAVLARNLHTLGHAIQQNERKRQKRRERLARRSKTISPRKVA
jgi:IS5 family transposase